jgi:hypothetical protein
VAGRPLRQYQVHPTRPGGYFGPEDERQFMRIQPRPEIGVDEIDADRLGLDQHLTGPRDGLWLLDESKDFRSAGLLDFDRVHVQTFQLGAGSLSMVSLTTDAGSRYGAVQLGASYLLGGESCSGAGRKLAKLSGLSASTAIGWHGCYARHRQLHLFWRVW